jgi:thiamine biosynthesis lipoprotein
MDTRVRRLAAEIILGAVLVAVLLLFTGRGDKSPWPPKRVDVDSGQRPCMGTFARVIAVAPSEPAARKCIEEAMKRIREVDTLMSDYSDKSEISELNRHGAQRPVRLSGPTFEVLQESVKLCRLTGGAFDVTVGPVVDMWRTAAAVDSPPTSEDMRLALSRVGCDMLILNEQDSTASLAAEGMRIDLGAIAKGYAVDRACEAAMEHGAIGAMVEIGGDIRCFGAPPKGRRHWYIGLEDARPAGPGRERGELLLRLRISDEAVATSGHYRRYGFVEGQKVSHIVDPASGRGSDMLTSATIICDTAMRADAIATAAAVTGAEKGLELVEETPGTEAILVGPAPEYELIKSSGAGGYIK